MSFVSCPQKNRNKRLDQDYSNRFIAPLLASALEKGQTVNFLTLPAQEWAHERSIVERFPENRFCFWGCENNPSIHSMATSVAEQLSNDYGGRATFNMTHQHGHLSDALIRSPQTGIPSDHHFDIIYADYLGYICPSVMNDINAILSKDINSGPRSVLMLTLGLKSRNSVYFCADLIRKWEHTPSFKDIQVDDDHMWKRVDKNTYSPNTKNILKALALEIRQMAETNSSNKAGYFYIHSPHIYYGSRNYGNRAPQIPMGTLAFTRMF